jgi:hypothetical protein
MASGSPRANRPKRAAAGRGGFRSASAALAVIAVLAAASAAALTAVMRGPSFDSALRSLDSALSSPSSFALDAAFASAYRFAGGAGDWLSVLKRARASDAAGDRGRYAQAASLALRRRPESEPLAAAAAHAYLRADRPDRALALFERAAKGSKSASLSPDARPELWAEAFARARPEGGATVKDYARLASIVGEGTPYLGASILSIAEGDLAEARYWLVKAIDEGAAAPADLMWDCGLYDELSRRGDSAAGSRELAILGDAAWKAGDSELAKARWERSIALEPRRSWKPYASLALASASGGESSASYWARLRAAFLSGPAGETRDGALAAYASELAREGRDSEALKLLHGNEASSREAGSLLTLAAAIRGKSEPEGRLASDYARLAETMPDDPVVLGARLRLLAERGFADELAQACEAAAKRGSEPEYGWFYDAWVLAASGRYAEAADLLSKRGSDAAGPAAAFALGTLRAAQGLYSEAADLFDRAAEYSLAARERAAALKGKGRAMKAAGDSLGAAAAFKAAAIADPEDAEAAVMARSASLR